MTKTESNTDLPPQAFADMVQSLVDTFELSDLRLGTASISLVISVREEGDHLKHTFTMLPGSYS